MKTAIDPFFAGRPPISAARHAAVVTPNDAVDLSNVTSALIVTVGTGGGAIVVIMADGADFQPITIPLAPPVNPATAITYQFKMQARRVLATGTNLGSGGSVVAFWS